MNSLHPSIDEGIPIRDIESQLRKAAHRLGTIFSDPIDSRSHPDGVPRLTLNEIIEKTQKSSFADHHQTYPIDKYLATISMRVIEGMLTELNEEHEEHDIQAGIRIEHDITEVRDSVTKKVTVVSPEKRYIVHANPVDGSDNYSAALNSWATVQKSNLKLPLNSDSCVTLTFSEKKDPFNPIAVAVYSFRNHMIYGAYRGHGSTYIGTFGLEPAIQLHHKVIGLNPKSVDIRFFIADYKYDLIEVPTTLERSLLEYGGEKGIQVDRIRGTVGSVPNILKVIIENEALGYFDYRPAHAFNDSAIKGGLQNRKFASLKATNVLAVLPVALSRGYEARTVRGNLHAQEFNDFDLSDPDKNPDISLILAPSELFNGKHPYQVMIPVRRAIQPIEKLVSSFIEEHKGTGYKIPGYQLTKLISGSGAYKSVWGATPQVEMGKEVVVKIFEPSKKRGEGYLEKAAMSQERMEENEALMAKVRGRSLHVGFLYSIKSDGWSPSRNSVHYMIEHPFEQTTAEKFKLGQIAPLGDIVKLGNHLIDAVAAGHSLEEKIIHGDIKDENFGITSDGDGILTDYGISMILNGKDKRERNIGSIHAMAPELYEEGTQPSTQSDVFAIATVLTKWATGYHPFSPKTEKPSTTGTVRDEYESMTKKELNKPDYSHIYSRIKLPKEMSDIIIKGLQKNPMNRYMNACEMLEGWSKVVSVYDTYLRIRGDTLERAEKADPNLYLSPHLELTEHWLLELNPLASFAERIAAVAHDYERLTEGRIRYNGQPNDLENYIKYKEEHAHKSAQLVKKKLEEIGADAALASAVESLIHHHDDPKVNSTLPNAASIQSIVDADSLSFFQNNLNLYSQEPKNKERIELKAKFMYDKMSDRAKEFMRMQSFYPSIISHLPGAA